MKHLPLVTKSRAKPPPSRPPPPTLLFMLSLRPVLISQRINRARATEKKKFYRVATRIGIFPPPPASLLPLRGNVDRDADPLGRWRPRFRCSIRRRSSQSVAHPSLRYSRVPAPNRDPFLLSREKIFRGVEKEGGGCVDKSTPDNRVAFCEARSFPIQRENGLDLGRFNDVVILPSRLS